MDLFAALVSFCVSVVCGFVVRPLFSLFQATYTDLNLYKMFELAKFEPNAGNKHYFLRVLCGGEGV